MNPYEGLDQLSPSQRACNKLMHGLLGLLKDADGELLARKEVIKQLPDWLKKQGVELTAWELEKYEDTTGYTRWISMLQFYTLGLCKAGYLRKNKGIWYLTPEGEVATKMTAIELRKDVDHKYRLWKEKRDADNNSEPDKAKEDSQEESSSERNQIIELEQLEEDAREGIRAHIKSLNPYEFQDLVAALLRGMGYFTPFISPKGKDGGIDIIGYQDPLGAKSPRIKVQVKHRPEATIGVDDIRGLSGLLNKDGDMGLFVTSGKYSSDSERFSRDSHTHIKLIDGNSLIDLWAEFYSNLPDEDKNRLPLKSISFLGSND